MPTEFPGGKRPLHTQRLLLGLVVIVVGLYVAWSSSQQPAVKPKQVPAGPQAPDMAGEAVPIAKDAVTPAAEPETDAASAGKIQARIPNVTVRDQDGKVIFRGTVDVGPTLQRIDRGEKLRFSHDGSVFENRERRLPKKAAGYYREYVHPTAGQRGPGPQRIVKGKGEETYYTHDHYRTFQRLDQP